MYTERSSRQYNFRRKFKKMKAELIGRARPGLMGQLNDQPARS